MHKTTAEVQAQLGTSMNDPRILMSFGPNDGTTQDWYVSGGVKSPGKFKYIRTTASDSAATQAAAINTSLLVNGG